MGLFGSPGGIRTPDQVINSHLHFLIYCEISTYVDPPMQRLPQIWEFEGLPIDPIDHQSIIFVALWTSETRRREMRIEVRTLCFPTQLGTHLATRVALRPCQDGAVEKSPLSRGGSLDRRNPAGSVGAPPPPTPFNQQYVIHSIF